MLQIVLAKARQPRRRWPRSRSGIRLECHRQGSPSAARTSPPRPHPSGATSPPHRLREWRQPAFDASRGQGGAPRPRGPIRSSPLRAYCNHEGEAWHSPFAKGPICLAGEMVRLRAGDIDSEQMIIRIVQSKGLKDRHVMLPVILVGVRAVGPVPAC